MADPTAIPRKQFSRDEIIAAITQLKSRNNLWNQILDAYALKDQDAYDTISGEIRLVLKSLPFVPHPSNITKLLHEVKMVIMKEYLQIY